MLAEESRTRAVVSCGLGGGCLGVGFGLQLAGRHTSHVPMTKDPVTCPRYLSLVSQSVPVPVSRVCQTPRLSLRSQTRTRLIHRPECLALLIAPPSPPPGSSAPISPVVAWEMEWHGWHDGVDGRWSMGRWHGRVSDAISLVFYSPSAGELYLVLSP